MTRPEHPPESDKHKEAFALMWYACERMDSTGKGGCGHRERIWNSRDGVTPFATICPSCNAIMSHVELNKDQRAPEHKLSRGQRFWRDGTRDEAIASVKRRIARFEEMGQPVPPEVQKSLFDDIDKGDKSWEWRPGWPRLDVYTGEVSP